MLDWLRGPKVDHPMADPKAARRIIDEIPSQDSIKAMAEVNFWLDSVVRTEGFRVDRRHELLDALDQAAKAHVRRLSLDYLPARQQKFQENRLWTAVFEFWRLAADGYLLCIEGFQSGAAGSAGLKNELPATVGRTLRSLTMQLKWSLLRYGPVEDRIWADLGRVYAFAESRQFADRTAVLYPGHHGESTAEREFLKALVLAISSADGLLPNEIEIAERTVAFFSRLFVIDQGKGGARTHCFDLAMRRPPGRAGSAPAAPSVRYFGVGAGLDEVQRLLGVAHREGALPSDINLGAEYDLDVVVKVWRHLVSYWSPTPPARNAERRPANVRLTVVHGFERLVSTIDPQDDESLDFSGGGGAPVVESESWVAENASDSGYGAAVPAVRGDWVKVGSLVGVKPEGAQHWGVGVVRRMTRDGQSNRHVGLHLLARAAIPVRVSPAGTVSSFSATRGEQKAVLLSPRPDEHQQIRVLLRVGTFGPAQSLEMRVQGKMFLLMPVNLVEGTDAYDVARFKVLERVS